MGTRVRKGPDAWDDSKGLELAASSVPSAHTSGSSRFEAGHTDG